MSRFTLFLIQAVDDAVESAVSSVGDAISQLFLKLQNMLYKLVLLLTEGVYKLANICYQIFISLAHINIFSNKEYSNFTNKIYAILGVVMLFVVAYNVLTYIIDPDKNKGGQSAETLVKKIFSSFIIIAVCPFVFSLMVRIQTAVIDGGFIDKFFGDTTISIDGFNAAVGPGTYMEHETFSTFIYAEDGSSDSAVKIDYDKSESQDYLMYSLKGDVSNLTCDNLEGKVLDCKGNGGCTLEEIKITAMLCDSYKPYYYVTPLMVNDTVTFNFLVSLLAGAVLVYVLAYYCFDAGIRIFKMFFFELIAPICVACRVVPSKESVYKTWFDNLKNTYLSIMIRIFVLRLEVWMLKNFVASDLFNQVDSLNVSWLVQQFTKAFIIIGLLLFLKEAPDLINKMFGIEEAKIGSIAKRFKEATSGVGKVLGRGARVAGAYGQGMLNNIDNLRQNRKNYQKQKSMDMSAEERDKLKKRYRRDLTAGILGIGAGGMSAGMRALYKTSSLPKKIEQLKDFHNNILDDATWSSERRDDRLGKIQEKRNLEDATAKRKELQNQISALLEPYGITLADYLEDPKKFENLEQIQKLLEQEKNLNIKIEQSEEKLAKSQEKQKSLENEIKMGDDQIKSLNSKNNLLMSNKQELQQERNRLLSNGQDTSLVDKQIQNIDQEIAVNTSAISNVQGELSLKKMEKVKIDAEVDINQNTLDAAKADMDSLKSSTEYITYNEVISTKQIYDNNETDIKQIYDARDAEKEKKRRDRRKFIYGADVDKQIADAEQLYKDEFKKADEVFEKFGSKLVMKSVDSIQKAFEKQDFFENNSELTAAFVRYVNEHDITTVKRLATNMSYARNEEELIAALPDYFEPLIKNQENFTQVAEQGAKAILGPLMKTAKGELNDALNGVVIDPSKRIVEDPKAMQAILDDEVGRAYVSATKDTVSYIQRTHLDLQMEEFKTNPIFKENKETGKPDKYDGEPFENSSITKSFFDTLEKHDKIMENFNDAVNLSKKVSEARGALTKESKNNK